MRNFSGGATAEFDADFTSGDAISRIASVDLTSATGTSDTGGLVTQFVFESAEVPEPVLSTVCGIALAAMVLRRRALRQR